MIKAFHRGGAEIAEKRIISFAVARTANEKRLNNKVRSVIQTNETGPFTGKTKNNNLSELCAFAVSFCLFQEEERTCGFL